MTDQVSPIAARIIQKCGGHKAVALITGAKLSAVYRWTYPRSRGGRGGVIPRGPQAKLIEAARAGLVNLTAEDFVDLPPRRRSVAA